MGAGNRTEPSKKRRTGWAKERNHLRRGLTPHLPSNQTAGNKDRILDWERWGNTSKELLATALMGKIKPALGLEGTDARYGEEAQKKL